MPYDDGSGAAPMDDEDFHWQQPQAAPHAGEAQDGAAAHAGASRVNESQLPSTEDLHLWLAAIVERDGLEKLLEALLSVARRADVMRTIEQLCDVRFSIEPIQQLEDGQEVPATCTANPAHCRRACAWRALLTPDHVGGCDAVAGAIDGVVHEHQAAHGASPSSPAQPVSLQIRALLALRAGVWARRRHL